MSSVVSLADCLQSALIVKLRIVNAAGVPTLVVCLQREYVLSVAQTSAMQRGWDMKITNRYVLKIDALIGNATKGYVSTTIIIAVKLVG